MDSQYYKDYYILERNHWWFLARASILNKYIERNISSGSKNLKILNVGVATGASTEMLGAFGAVTSIEYEQECIEYIRERVSIEVIQGSILDLKFEDNSFDLVCAFDVIEHVQYDDVAAR
jgi:2-polyprenyl-3-methyl-5-hydroxy-6-metoxy-1,4-benzoquinol methylase